MRNPATVAITHKHLTIAKGDVLDYSVVEAVVRGQDAVLSALGGRTLGKTTMLSECAKHILGAMEKLGVRRLVSESPLAVGELRPTWLSFQRGRSTAALRRSFAD
jgi:putative NADH-flavin reductase